MVMVGQTHSLVLESGAVLAQDELLRRRRELCETGNGQVLVVEVGVLAEEVFGLACYVSVRGSSAPKAGNDSRPPFSLQAAPRASRCRRGKLPRQHRPCLDPCRACTQP